MDPSIDRRTIRRRSGPGFRWAVTVGGVVLAAALLTPAGAQDDPQFTADFEACSGSKGTPAAIVAACTRLIDEAAVENSLVGFFYAIRATWNDDRASNCRDARRAHELLLQEPGNEASLKALSGLMDANC